MFDLSGKVALVTGGAMGIGKGIALRLAEAGASVVIGDLNIDAANETVKEIEATGGKAKAISMDTSKTEKAGDVVSDVINTYGDIDILVNNAGIYRFMSAVAMSKEMWQKTIDINLTGVFFLAKEVANAMIKAGHGGRIINIASTDAFKPTGNLSHYDASKGGVVMLTKALAQEFAPHGIRVNAIAPGGIGTPGVGALMADAKMTPEQAEEQNKVFLERLPARRMGEPDDIAKVALFLASEGASYMVGSTVIVDGGLLIM
jgi:2-deoxy-D-gluconate 3-dehydrogenase